MSVKRLSIWLERFAMQWKGIGLLMYIPFLANYVLLPFSVYVLSSAAQISIPSDYFAIQGEFFIPFMSTWWMLMILYEHLEGDGNEILWLRDNKKLFDVIMCILIYAVSLVPLFAVLKPIWNIELYIYISIIQLCVFYIGLAFAVAYISRSLVAAFLTILMYTLYKNTVIQSVMEVLNIDVFQFQIGYVIVGIICFLLGMTYMRHWKER